MANNQRSRTMIGYNSSYTVSTMII